MFELKRQVTYSQLAPDKTVSPTELLRFFQDAAVEHTTACGYSLEKLADINRAWILLSTHLRLEKPIRLSDEIKIKTWTYEFARVCGPRAFVVENAENGTVYAHASAMWAYVDIASGRPKEIPEDMLACFGEGEPALCSYIRRPPKYEAAIHISDFRVLKRDLDTNGHMNNVRYVEYAMEALPDDTEISEMEIYYKHSAFYGDTVSLYSMKDEDGNILTNLKNMDGETCTYIKFIIK